MIMVVCNIIFVHGVMSGRGEDLNSVMIKETEIFQSAEMWDIASPFFEATAQLGNMSVTAKKSKFWI